MRNEHAAPVVIVVEDELFLRLNLAEWLRDAGCTVFEAVSGEDAVANLRNGNRFDFVITDIRLGGPLTGWDVAKAFRAGQPGIPVVYVSGNAADPSRQVPGSVFLSKPCMPDQIWEACLTRFERSPKNRP